MSRKNLVFVDVDTQFDFMHPDGSLYVPGAIEITPNLQALIEFARKHEIPVVASVDAHPADDPEFSQFPPHCVRNTPGQEKVAATRLAPAFVVPASAQAISLPRGFGSIVLEKTIFSLFGNENAEQVFRELDAEKYVVFGVATDYCVKAAVMGLLERGYPVAVVEDAISGVTPEGSRVALDEMRAAGAVMTSTAEVLSW